MFDTPPIPSMSDAPAETAAAAGEPQQPAQQQPEEASDGAEAAQPESLPANADELLKEFFSEVREVDRDNEVNRILGAFKLNPFEQLGVHFDATADDIKRQYRKVSLLVHPDKCTHPRAIDAFRILGQAHKELLDDARREGLVYLLNHARDEVRKERGKKTKHDAVVRLAGMLHEEGTKGVLADWEASDEFHQLWKVKARDVLAKSEWRKRKMTKRLKSEEERVEEDEKTGKEINKRLREHTKKWEETRETRVGTWRDFVTKKGSGKKEKMGGIKPPKIKTSDEEHTYIQRPVGEQFRPPPHVVPKGKGPPRQ